MSKYEKMNNNVDLKQIILEDEQVIWSGKPKKSAFILNKALTMLPIALIWLLFDGSFIFVFLKSGEIGKMLYFIIPFFAIHLMPVWTWLSNILTASKKWENTEYAITDKRIIITSGFIGMNYQTLYYKDIKNVRLNVGVLDKMLNVGDIYFDVLNGGNTMFLDIEDAYKLYTKLQKIVLDIQTDIEYPNDLRPSTNSGYNTKYEPKD